MLTALPVLTAVQVLQRIRQRHLHVVALLEDGLRGPKPCRETLRLYREELVALENTIEVLTHADQARG